MKVWSLGMFLRGNRLPASSWTNRKSLPTRLALFFLCLPHLFAGTDDYSYIPFEIEFELKEPVETAAERQRHSILKARDFRFSDLPGGRPCAFFYIGPKKASTHRFFHKMGFRSTVFLSPEASAEQIRALEDSGVEIAASSFPGGKGTYQSFIGDNTVQEAFDVVAWSRHQLMTKASGAVRVAAISGHLNPPRWILQRDLNRRAGYGAVASDAGFRLAIYDAQSATACVLGHRGKKQTHQWWYRSLSSMRTSRIPNELIYYQLLANAFDAATKRVGPGAIIRIQLRDFDESDLLDVKEQIEPYGKHPDIWHVTFGDVLSNQYLREMVRFEDVKMNGTRGVLKMGIRADVFGPVIQTPLSVRFPKGANPAQVKLAGMAGQVCERKSYVAKRKYYHAVLPIQQAIRDGIKVEWSFEKEVLSVPDESKLTVTLKNFLKTPIENTKLAWYAPTGLPAGADELGREIYGEGMSVSGGTDLKRIKPGQEVKIGAVVKTGPNCRFGILPISLALQGRVNGVDRLFLDGAEVPIMPLLGLEMIPHMRMPIRKDETLYYQVTVSNKFRFLHPETGACEGILRLDMPPGMACEPEAHGLKLGEKEARVFVFKVTSRQWNPMDSYIRPQITLAGQGAPLSILEPGVLVIRDQKRIDIKPLDESGLLVYASYDDATKNGAFDRSAGKAGAYHFPTTTTAYNDKGVRNSCVASQPTCNIYDTYGNIDYRRGTAAFWAKRDPLITNELRVKGDPKTSWQRTNNNQKEALFHTPGLQIYRYPDWSDAPGYLEAIYFEAFGDGQYGNRRVVHIPYTKKEQYAWTHIAVTWDVDARSLRLYKNGKLAGELTGGPRPWHPFPWDQGGFNFGHPLITISMDHGKKALTLRDEVYIYDRPLSAALVKANMEKAKQP